MSTAASQERVTLVWVRDEEVMPVGVEGALVSAVELETVTVTEFEDYVFPAASRATAVSV